MCPILSYQNIATLTPVYPDHNILPKSGEVKDLGILMSENCDFDSHIASVAKKCSRLCGWILRTFSTRSKSY